MGSVNANRKNIGFRMDVEKAKELHRYCIDHNTSLVDVMNRMVDDLLKNNRNNRVTGSGVYRSSEDDH